MEKAIYSDMENAAALIKNKFSVTPEILIVCGSGFNTVTEILSDGKELKFTEINGFPRSEVKGHKGRFVFGKFNKLNVMVSDGRLHMYEGCTALQSVMTIILAKFLGAKTALLTNSSGGINKTFSAGDLMIIDDHINLTGRNPLIGANNEAYGERFPDMTAPYDLELSDLLYKSAKEQGLELKRGVYCQLLGPSYETKAEVKMLGVLGADCVGMSTVMEAVTANYFKMRVVGLSLISNMASGISQDKLMHNDVLKTASNASVRINKILKGFLEQFNRE